jgi:molecular chaperone DnaK
VAELKTALEGEDLDDIKAKSETLMQASMKLGEMAYQAQQDDEGDGAGGGDGTGDDGPAAAEAEGADDVLDADFEEVNDDDKKSTSA